MMLDIDPIEDDLDRPVMEPNQATNLSGPCGAHHHHSVLAHGCDGTRKAEGAKVK